MSDIRLADYIRVYDIPFPENFLEKLLDKADFLDGYIDKYVVDKTRRNCVGSDIIEPDLCHVIWSHLDTILREYSSIVPYLHIRENRDGYTLLKYEKGGVFKEHIDVIDIENNEKNIRQLAIVILLNDEFKGGKLSFFNGQYTVNLKKNQAVIYPANFLYPHQVEKVTDGTRYSIVTWVL